MDIRQITQAYAVSPQIDPEDMATLAAAGFTTVIDNRPDAEIPPSHHAHVMQTHAEAAGLAFVVLPVTHDTLNTTTVAAQNEAIAAATGPVLAYCASGTRCTIIWALGQAGSMPADEIVAAAANAGYDLSGLRPQLDRPFI